MRTSTHWAFRGMSSISLGPNLNVKANITVVHDDDDVTVIIFNRSHRQRINKTAVRERPLIAATARSTLVTPCRNI